MLRKVVCRHSTALTDVSELLTENPDVAEIVWERLLQVLELPQADQDGIARWIFIIAAVYSQSAFDIPVNPGAGRRLSERLDIDALGRMVVSEEKVLCVAIEHEAVDDLKSMGEIIQLSSSSNLPIELDDQAAALASTRCTTNWSAALAFCEFTGHQH